MPEKIKQIWNRILEWLNKFTKKQKLLMGSLAAIVILALGILAFVVTRPTMTKLITCESVTEASQVRDLLDGEGIEYEIQEDQLTFYINKENLTDASYLLGTNKIQSSEYSIEDVFDGSFSTTESDKTKKYQVYLEQKIKNQLEELEVVETATCNLSIPPDDGTVLAQDKDTYASITLKLKKQLDDGAAEGIAQFVATAVGNDDTSCITILDSGSTLLYSGAEDNSEAGQASTQLALRSKKENMVKSEIKSVLLGTNLYDNVEVGLNLSMDFSKVNIVDHQYSVPEGMSQGYLTENSEYTSESVGGYGGVPGTDTNADDTTYVLDNGDYSTNTITDTTEKHALNETITTTDNEMGEVNYDESSATVVAVQYVVYDEDVMREQGRLDELTFDEFVEQNQDRIEIEVPEDTYTMIANATGFSVDRLSVKAYQVPFFQYSTTPGLEATDIFQIALAVLILLMLAYVVYRSTRREENEEYEAELSVESLLEATKSTQEELEDIGFNDKSETRILIEKFVDERPESVAALLRNWIEEEWDD